MFIQVRHMFINVDWVARTIRPSGNMPKTTASRLSRRILTFRNEASFVATHQKSSGFVQSIVPVLKSRVICAQLSRPSSGSSRRKKSRVWSWGFGPRPSNRFALGTTFSNRSAYYRARYYDANVGRFTTEDATGFANEPDCYVYVRNNSVLYSDPRGLTSYQGFFLRDDSRQIDAHAVCENSPARGVARIVSHVRAALRGTKQSPSRRRPFRDGAFGAAQGKRVWRA